MEEIHDRSRVDGYARNRQRVAFLSAAWRPMAAGAAGAALVIAAVYVTLPKFTTREVVVDHVVQTDVAVDHIVPRDVQVDRVIPHDVVIDIPRFAATPAEKRFLESPAFADAEIKGRIIASPDGISLAFDTGKSWVPTDPNRAADFARFVGDLGACSPIPGNEAHFHCVALHNGKLIPVPQKPAGRPT